MSQVITMNENEPQKLSGYQRLFKRVEALSASPYALWAMLGVAFVDGSVFPVPPFAVLVPMVLAEPKKWWRFALWGTLASLAGGVLGYYIGTAIHAGAAGLFHIDLNAPINRFGIHSTVGHLLGDQFWVLALLCSILPTPFKVVAIGSGMVAVPFPRFMMAAVIGRTVRFVIFAGGTRFLRGERAETWWQFTKDMFKRAFGKKPA